VAVGLLSGRHLLDQRVRWRAGDSLHLDPPFPLRRIARKHMQQLHLSKPRIDRRGPCDAAAEVPLDGIGCQHSMTAARGCHVPWICDGETSERPKRLSREKLFSRQIGLWLLRAHFISGLLNNLVERTLAGRDTIRNCREHEAEPSPCLVVVPWDGEGGFTSLQKTERVDRSGQLGRVWHAYQRPIDVMFTWSERGSSDIPIPTSLASESRNAHAPTAAVHHLRAAFCQLISSGNAGMTLIQSLQFQ
jgi:hypothetical protein